MKASYQSTFPCPISQLLTVMSAKWTVDIMRELCLGPTRTTSFLKHIPGLSMKVLSQSLHRLEEYGFIHRQEYAELPPKVEYRITDRGRKLLELFNQIKQFADEMHQSSCVCPLHSGAAQEPCGDFHCPGRRATRTELAAIAAEANAH